MTTIDSAWVVSYAGGTVMIRVTRRYFFAFKFDFSQQSQKIEPGLLG